MQGFAIAEARDAASLEACRALFREYQRSLGLSLDFQGFEAELAGLPGAYAPPRGRLLLATLETLPVGCAALRPLANGDCEMKRLYLRDAARGSGRGRALALAVIEAARGLGYARILLDTLPSMATAQSLYARLGFREIAPYNDNPIAGTRLMALCTHASPRSQRR